MGHKHFPYALILAAGLISCSDSADNLIDDKVYQVSIDNCKTSIDLKLSDLIEDGELIQLETTEESLLGDRTEIIISDDYIIATDRNGFFKFSSEGQFIKKIINTGRGPQELSTAIDYYFSNKNSLLFIQDRSKNTDVIQIYDVSNEKFMNPVKKCFPGDWFSFSIYRDSIIIGTLGPFVADTNRYLLFLQDMKGVFITGITGDRKILDLRDKTETYQRLLICTGDDQIYTHYIYDDTLFIYDENRLFPYLIVSYKFPRDYTRAVIPEVGEKRISFPSVDNPGFIILSEATLEGFTQVNMGSAYKYRRAYYFLNKADGSFSKIKSYTDNLTGKTQPGDGETIDLPVILPGGKLYVLYNTSDLIKKDFTGLQESGFPRELCNRLTEITKNINEMDNPVLLIGTI